MFACKWTAFYVYNECLVGYVLSHCINVQHNKLLQNLPLKSSACSLNMAKYFANLFALESYISVPDVIRNRPYSGAPA
jgi:hypothetical protein